MNAADFTTAQRQFLRPLPGGILAFHPPPAPDDIPLSSSLVNALAVANHALGELDGTGRHLPNPHLLIGPYLRREAVLSSRIEGTQSGLGDILMVEASGIRNPDPDTREVINYVSALERGIAELPTLPVSLRLVRGLHGRLMDGVRGADRTPGEFRRYQNYVGPKGAPIEEATFVPPPAGPVLEAALDDWERFLHRDDDIPLLVRCAWMHYQFETIHPFADGNGRVGRLLIPLLLIERKVLSQPLLYVSALLERERDAYYDSLMRGRLTGDLTPWLALFLRAVETQARDASRRADRLAWLQESYHQRFARSRSAVLRPLIDMLFSRLVVSVPALARELSVSEPSAQAAVNALVSADILRESTGKKRGRVYVAAEVFASIMPEEVPPSASSIPAPTLGA
ncbi:MAG TPA: Fic family protein [Candidatus Limnocylindria bacterium]|nr:Fic family protein [Candidatus Limnocylindria bacterium]